MRRHNRILVVYLLIIALSIIGCGSQEISKPEQIPQVLDEITKATEDAIKENDLKSARLLWSRISEYGVKATESGYTELGKTLGKLASTYADLVQYLETGETKHLEIFQENFPQAIEELKKMVETEEE